MSATHTNPQSLLAQANARRANARKPLEHRETHVKYALSEDELGQEYLYESDPYNSVFCPTTTYNAKEKLRKWFEEIPVEFPTDMDMTEGMPAFFNPLIGSDYKMTCENVSYILEMLRNLALPAYTEKADFSLTEDGTHGFICVLECMTAALRFERKYRNNDEYEKD